MIYHLLDEPFSTREGLAIARNVANIMRFDESSTVVCPASDDTWGIHSSRIMTIPLSSLANRKGWRAVPDWLRRQLMSYIFRPFLSRLKPEDIVWCHNWAYVAAGLERAIHLRKARLLYHAHKSIASFASRSLFRSFISDAMIFNSEAMRQEALKEMPYLQNTHTVHNGADEALFFPNPFGLRHVRSVPTILFVGRLVSGKGVHVLTEAMRVLQERHIRTICKLVGSSHAGGRRDRRTAYIRSLVCFRQGCVTPSALDC
jgi:glycosyltransferase involved in cell wall biosynthesis